MRGYIKDKTKWWHLVFIVLVVILIGAVAAGCVVLLIDGWSVGMVITIAIGYLGSLTALYLSNKKRRQH